MFQPSRRGVIDEQAANVVATGLSANQGLRVDEYQDTNPLQAQILRSLRAENRNLMAGPPLLDEDYLILSTVHSAKGGERDVVHVIHAADGMIPSDMATGDKDEIEEERRLFYRRPRGLDDAHHFAQLTRFLPEPVQSLFERRTAGSVLAPEVSRSPRHSVDAALTALLES